MTNPFSGFLNRLQGGSNPRYLPVNDQTAQVPGGFPSDEPEIPDARPSPIVAAATRLVQTIIIKPFVFVLMVIFRILLTIGHTIFYKTVDNDKSLQPIDKVARFVRDLEDNVSENNALPPFFQGSYTQALYMATHRAKFLFVYLTNSNNEYDQDIFQNIIINPQFLEIFNDNPNIVIWGGDLTNPESYQLANSLNVTKFPFLGLLCLTTNTTMTPEGPIKSSPKISLISKVQGNFSSTPNALIQSKFKNKINRYEPELSVIRNDLRDKFMSQVLNKQQELNYQNSLRKDQLKKQAKVYERDYKTFLIYKSQAFKQWPQDNSTDCAKIAIKLADGSRSTFCFPADNLIEDIFIYVELINRELLDNDNVMSTLTEAEFDTRFSSFEPKFTFLLKSPLPPRVNLQDMQKMRIRDASSIYPNGVLIVEEN